MQRASRSGVYRPWPARSVAIQQPQCSREFPTINRVRFIRAPAAHAGRSSRAPRPLRIDVYRAAVRADPPPRQHDDERMA